jgi:hypothetical protein
MANSNERRLQRVENALKPPDDEFITVILRCSVFHGYGIPETIREKYCRVPAKRPKNARFLTDEAF